MSGFSIFRATLLAHRREAAAGAAAFALAIALVSCVTAGRGKPYSMSLLTPWSPFHGVNGLALNPAGDLFAASKAGQSVYQVNVADGSVATVVGAPDGGAADVAFAADGAMAWTNEDQGAVYLLEPGSVARRIFGDAPGVHGIAFAPDGALYVSQTGEKDALWALDRTAAAPPRKVVENIGGLRGFVFGPDDQIYGALADAKSVAKIDPKTGAVKILADGFVYPVAAAFGPDGALYVADGGDGTLQRVDLQQQRGMRVAVLRDGLEDIAINAQNIAYAAIGPDNTIAKIDLSARKISNLVEGKLGAPSDLVMLRSADGDTLGLADAFAYRVIDPYSGAIRDALRPYSSALRSPYGIGAGRHWVLLANPLAGSITVLDRMKDKPPTELAGFSMPLDALETEDGQFLVLDSSVGELTLVSAPDGAERRVLTKGLKQPVAMALDGMGGVYVTEAGAGRLVRVDLKTGALSGVAEGLAQPEGLDITSDGRVVVAEAGAKQLIAIEPSSGKVDVIGQNLEIGLKGPANGPPTFLTTGVAVGGDGAIYVSSDVTNGIYKFTRQN